jgi:hypothetical protein
MYQFIGLDALELLDRCTIRTPAIREQLTVVSLCQVIPAQSFCGLVRS